MAGKGFENEINSRGKYREYPESHPKHPRHKDKNRKFHGVKESETEYWGQ